MSSQDFLRILEQNPPSDTESGPDYFIRISSLENIALSNQYIKKKLALALNSVGFPGGINGLRAYLRTISTKVVNKSEKPAKFNWREVLKPVQALQKTFAASSISTNNALIEIETEEPIAVIVLADLHAGSWGTDYDLFTQITDELINTPGLYAVMLGDMLQMAIKLRGVREVSDNALPPEWQIEFLDAWLQDVHHKVLFSTWGNHAVMREEQAVGFSSYAKIFSRYTTYSNGIMHADVKVGAQTYKLACSHFFRGRSMYNPVHGQTRYGREFGQDRDVILAGDSHTPGILQYTEGGKEKLAMNCGSIQTNSGYAKRFFTLKTHPIFPCVVLDPKKKQFTPFWSVAEWLKFRGDYPSELIRQPEFV